MHIFLMFLTRVDIKYQYKCLKRSQLDQQFKMIIYPALAVHVNIWLKDLNTRPLVTEITPRPLVSLLK